MSYSSDRPPPGRAGYGTAGYGAAAYGPPPSGGWFSGWEPGLLLSEWLAFRPLRIALVVLAFIWWWPVGLATLLFMMWSRRMGCWSYGPRAYRQSDPSQADPPPWRGWARGCGRRAPEGSGNRAFDEYRAETLRRLEEEQRDFVGFLDRLRYAKDKAEFDQFLAERRHRSETPPGGAPDQPEQPNPA